VFKNYRVELGEILGKGSFGTVRIASVKGKESGSEPFKLAVKFQQGPGLEDEKKIADKIGQEWAVKHYEALNKKVEIDGKEYDHVLFMEVAEGGGLDKFIEKKTATKKEREEREELAKQMITIIEKMHESGIAHGDLKPANFLLMDKRQTQLKVADFGLSMDKQTAKNILKKYRRSQTPKMKKFGSPLYAAPEFNFCSTRPHDIRQTNTSSALEAFKLTDYWSVGVVLLELLYPEAMTEALQNIKKEKDLPQFHLNLVEQAKSTGDDRIKAFLTVNVEQRKAAIKKLYTSHFRCKRTRICRIFV